MKLAEILSDEELRQREFPVVRSSVFLGHAGVCPLPWRVTEAIRTFSEGCASGDQEEVFKAERIRGIREMAAELLGAQPSEIALVGPTSLGLSLIARGVKVRRGDNIVIYHDDYPSNVYPWMKLAERGVQVRFLNVRALGEIRKVDVMG